MKEKLYKIYKKYKISIFISLIIILLGILGLILFNKSSTLSSTKTNNYSLKYDSSWKIKEKEDNYIILKHISSNSKLKLEIIELNNEYKYSSIDDLIDEIIYNISNQNINYNLISKQNSTFTKLQLNGYKLLYETLDKQVMINTFKKSDKLVFISYESSNEYFDILLDSVLNIIYNFNVEEEKFNIKNNLNIEKTSIKYSNEERLDKLLNESTSYEIANNNYKVLYSIPSIFELYEFNTTYNYFKLKDIKDANMTINVNIYNKNIYEYLDKDNTSNIYSKYKTYKENNNFEEQLDKLDSKYEDSYIYKNYYTKEATKYNDNLEQETYQKKYENAELIYSLNKNHILIITIESSNISITEKLIKNLEIKEVTNYSSYTKTDKKDGYLLSELKRYDNYDKNSILKISLKLKDDYEEIDKKNNLYIERYFGLNYNDDKELYDYIVHYKLTNFSSNDINSHLNALNSMFSKAYGNYEYYKIVGDYKVNNKSFKLYEGGYTSIGGILFTNINRYKYYINHKALFYKLENGGYLIIEIKGNGKEISDEIIKEVTNFEIN